MSKPLFPLLGQLPAKAEDDSVVELPPDASPLDFMEAVYRNPAQPIGRRLAAAIAAAPFRHPKLAVTVSAATQDFAMQMEEIARQSGRSNVIDAKANHGPSEDYLKRQRALYQREPEAEG
jgi:hypothetical protein